MNRSFLSVVGGAIALTAATVFCSFATESPSRSAVNPDLHNIKGGHLIVVGRDQNVPFSMFDIDGNPAGHDVDILRAVAEHLNMTVEFRLGSWFRVHNDLRDGSADVLLSTAFLPEKKREFDLTIPIFAESHAMFARKGEEYQNFESLKELRIAVDARDPVGLQTIRSLDLIRNLTFSDTLDDAFALLVERKVDIVITRYSSGMEMSASFHDIIVVGPPLAPSFYSLAVQKGNRELLDDLNHTIDFLKNDGTIETINGKWLKIRDDDANVLLESPIFRYVLIVSAVLLIVVIWLLGWNYLMARKVNQRTHELRRMVAERTQELERQAQFRRVLRESNLAIFDIDITDNVISAEYHDLLGSSAQDIPLTSNYDQALQNFTPFVHHDDLESFQMLFSRNNLLLLSENGTKETAFEFRKQQENDIWVWVRATVSPWVDTTTGSVRAIIRVKDIDQEKRSLLRMQWQAERDALTGLYNRNSAETLISRILMTCDDHYVQGFYILDIDNFKAVNDTFGHGEGDLLLIETAHMLTRQFRGSDVIARLGGDEFVIFCHNCSEDLVIRRAEGILEEMVNLSGKRPQTPISFSIGIALFPHDGQTFKELYKFADEALYQAKRSGKNAYRLYGGA